MSNLSAKYSIIFRMVIPTLIKVSYSSLEPNPEYRMRSTALMIKSRFCIVPIGLTPADDLQNIF